MPQTFRRISAEQPAATAPATFNAVSIGGVAIRRDVSSSVRAVDRIDELDVVKGILVLVMVLYHWINYYVGLDWPGYRYLRFLTPSFIFLTGFLVSKVYLPKYSAAPGVMYRRLTVRGLKLLGLFVCANVLLSLIFGMPSLFNNLSSALVFSTVPVAFDVLLSISYFLLLLPPVLRLAGGSGTVLAVFAALSLVGAGVLNAWNRSNVHIDLLALAFAGLAAGTFPLPMTSARAVMPVALGYVAYVLAIQRWNATYLLQVVGVVLSLAALWHLARAFRAGRAVHRSVSRVGQYSLVLYMGQIVLLRLFTLVVSPQPDISLLREVTLAATVPLVVTVLLMFGTAAVLEAMRSRSRPAERLYRAVFA